MRVTPEVWECLDCGEVWVGQSAEPKTIEHVSDNGHHVQGITRPLTDSEHRAIARSWLREQRGL